ncbi:MAG: ferritin family protein [Planctomycetes bacterium]|nr:ferritin family protein [Planctomycetota bacterium]
MKNFNSADEVLDFAISQEQNAYDFYMKWSKLMKNPAMGKFFVELAQEEAKHKIKLEDVKAGKNMVHANVKIQNLKISEFTVDVHVDNELDYQSSLLLAMKREKAAYKLYSFLAEVSDDKGMKALFKGLAQEEAKHKLSLELEYDDNILTEN